MNRRVLLMGLAAAPLAPAVASAEPTSPTSAQWHQFMARQWGRVIREDVAELAGLAERVAMVRPA